MPTQFHALTDSKKESHLSKFSTEETRQAAAQAIPVGPPIVIAKSIGATHNEKAEQWHVDDFFKKQAVKKFAGKNLSF